MSGIDYDLFKHSIPQLLMENQSVIKRIIEGALSNNVIVTRNKMTLEDFLKCISAITSTNEEEKLKLFFKVFFTIIICVDDGY